jgi:hypothetical protein
MATVTFNMTGPEWAAYMKRLGTRFFPAAIRGVQSGAMRCIGIMQTRTDFAPPASERGTTGAVNTGLYKAAWKTAPLSNGAQVFNAQPYSPVIDGGRRPAAVGRSGIVNLERWAHNKLKLTGDAAKAAAWAIAKTLEKRALRAREVMSGGIDEMTKAVHAELQHELDVELTRR